MEKYIVFLVLLCSCSEVENDYSKVEGIEFNSDSIFENLGMFHSLSPDAKLRIGQFYESVLNKKWSDTYDHFSSRISGSFRKGDYIVYCEKYENQWDLG